MAFFPEISKKKKLIKTAFLLVVLSLSVFSSCNSSNVLVISDPYINLMYGGKWNPAGKGFQLRAGMKGYRVINVEMSDQLDIETILEIDNSNSDILVVSPLVARKLPVRAAESRRIIVAGAESDSRLIGAEYLSLDRNDAFREVGRIAGEADGSVFAVFNSSTARKRTEFDVFLNSFLEASGDIENLTFYEKADSRDNEIPESFLKDSESAELLLLFAGSENLKVLSQTQESMVPVIGEYLQASGISGERIIGSIEDNPGVLTRRILEQMGDSGASEGKAYPARLLSK